ncbi:hypothetical protein [Butyrivibrio sp. YAB3001]|uniref:hypothetical protein n=1 Tax=Butyrivibrio sp. YAB3001 TaxID=1520812 RepID=UPI0008F63A03|nr:hypothetical protein [Butyrivibrio sp. YAB3001]SFC60572.1 hypothetical protein SAMN02910398_02668 [Butyrivibrio sp. YAB3001]
MELMNKWAILVGICVFAICLGIALFFRKKTKDKFVSGLKASNTSLIKSSPIYKALNRRYRVLMGVLICAFIGSVVSALVLVARPFKTQDIYSGVKKRDIIICMDVSYSLYELNSEITDYLKGVVKGLAGDRIGISIFNTSSVTFVPLTDDYDYVAYKLDELSEYFSLQKELYEEIYDHYEYVEDMPDNVAARYYELRDKLDYYDAGTLYNNMDRGSSLIGEGLGSALYSFPYIGDSERTRVIIMSTDNQLNSFSREIMNLREASDYCKSNKVTLFSIFPAVDHFYQPEEYSYTDCKEELEKASKKTGGKLYVRTNDLPFSAIVQDIQKQEVMTVNMVMTRQTQDMPRNAFIALIGFLIVTSAVGLVLQK